MPVALAVVAVVATVAATTTSIISGNQSRAAGRHAQDLSEQAANEQRAQNAQNAAAEARQQYRQDRIARARILQQSNNGGTEASSGEIGALGSLQTQFASNQGTLWSNYDRAQRIGDLQTQANQSIFQANSIRSRGAGISSIFSSIGSAASMGYGAYGKGITGTTPQPGQAGYNANSGFDNPSNYG